MANLGISFISLLWDILNSRTGEIGPVQYEPQKPMFDFRSPYEQTLPRSLPEEQGVRSDWVSDLVMDLYNCKPAHVHQLTILRHGNIIYEGGFDPYPSGLWHVTYSMCKSFTGLAIGLLVDDGSIRLEDHMIDLLPERRTLLRQIKFQHLTVRDLLIMSSGSSCNELGAISGNDWAESFLDAALKVQPGTEFDYNSMNSFMLSAIVSNVTGMSMFEFLKMRIFDPMGIRKIFWEKSPKGITKGGWGLFIRQEDAAKLGLLFLRGGNWHGRQLISRQWMEDALSPHNATGNVQTPYYGYQLWLSDHPGGFAFNGMLGQNVYCYPDLDAIIVTNAGNSEIFQGGGMTGIIHDAVEKMQPSDGPILSDLPQTKRAQERLQQVQSEVEGRKKDGALPAYLASLDGQIYEMKEKSVGLFPLIMQVIHNNYTRGISFLRFRVLQGRLFLDFMEGTTVHILPVSFGRGIPASIDMNGEKYLVSCMGRLAVNEDALPVLVLRFCFLEEATERGLKIVFQGEGKILLLWDETPGNVIILDTLEYVNEGALGSHFLMNSVMKQLSPELIRRTIQSAVQPSVPAVRITQEELLRKLRETNLKEKEADTAAQKREQEKELSVLEQLTDPDIYNSEL